MVMAEKGVDCGDGQDYSTPHGSCYVMLHHVPLVSYCSLVFMIPNTDNMGGYVYGIL